MIIAVRIEKSNSKTQQLSQTSGLSARNLNLLAVPQLDTQPAVDISFGGFDPAEVDDLETVRPKGLATNRPVSGFCPVILW